MKAAIGFALILIAGFLLYEVVSGHAVALINAIRIGAPSTSSSSSNSATQPNADTPPTHVSGKSNVS